MNERRATHYEVLGVHPTASQEELRRAYIAQARLHHPDRVTSTDEAAAAEAQEQMRRINQAWAVLRDPTTRRSYDAGLEWHNGHTSTGSRVRVPSSSFTPYRPDTAEDPDEDYAWRYEPDRGDPSTVPPRLLLAAPPAALALGLTLMVLSIPTGIRALTAAGLVCLFLAALLFVGAPVVALFRSQISEERARRRR